MPSLDEAVDSQQEANAAQETYFGQPGRHFRWIPPSQRESEFEESPTPNWMFDDFRQMVEGAEVQQTLGGNNFLQMVRQGRTAEPASLVELYSKWFGPKQEVSPGIKKPLTPNAFPKRSRSPAFNRKRRAEDRLTAEPITLTKAHSMIPAMQDDLQFDPPATPKPSSLLDPNRVVFTSTAEPLAPTEPQLDDAVTPNAFSGSSLLHAPIPRRAAEIAFNPVFPTKSHTRLISTMQNGTAALGGISMPSSPRERVVEAAAEPITHANARHMSIPSVRDDSLLNGAATDNWFSNSSPHGEVLDPYREAVIAAEPETLAEPQFHEEGTSSLVLDPKGVVETEPRLDEPEMSSSQVGPTPVVEIEKRVLETERQLDGQTTPSPRPNCQGVEMAAELAVTVTITEPKIDETTTPNGIFIPFPLSYPKQVVESEPQFHEPTTSSSQLDPNRVVQTIAEPVALTEPKTVETATANGFCDSFPLPDPNGMVETTTITVSDAYPRSIPATQDETTPTRDEFYSANGVADPKRAVEIPATQDDTMSSPLLEPDGVVETTTITLSEPQSRSIPATRDETTPTPNAFSPASANGVADPKRAVEIPASQDETTSPHDAYSSANGVADPKRAVDSPAGTEPTPPIDPPPTPTLKLPTLEDLKLNDALVPNIRLARTSTLLVGLVIVTITLATLHQKWARTSHS
ncbi:hypothetical protein M413DRAFT_290317 [Hebeloma cylindrosporum]|uniref:Uncharacterized protein n=1 Tax=Hebeloma cylindrosporum TaxID=76867 RepID=A0A0C3BYC9_HEBCY|nr:hypothetical protein M413DRAFT_290317 [Hebeloma cylindrosporum h7]